MSDNLRQRAEESFKHSPDVLPVTSIADAQELVQELRVHQIELEMQNEELRRTQRELEELRDHYVELYDFAPVGYITVDREGFILEANLTGATMLGIERVALIRKKKLSDFISHETQDEWFLYRRRLFEGTQQQRSDTGVSTGSRESVELAFQKDDKSPFYVRLESIAIHHGAEEPLRALIALTDVTARRWAEDTMRRSRNALNQAQGIAHIGSWEWDPVLNQVTASDELCRLFDLEQREDLPIKAFLLTMHPGDRARVEHRISEALKGTRPYRDVEYRVVHQDGSERIILAQGSVLRDDAGVAVRMQGTARDVTEERTLHRRVEYLSRFPAENPNPVLRVLSDGTLRYANSAAAPVLEVWKTKTDKKVPHTWRKHVSEVVREGISAIREMEAGERTYSICIAPVPERDYANLYGTDITELKLLHKQETLAASARTALDTINAMREGLALIDMEGTVRSTNPALCELTGYAKSDLEGKNMAELIDRFLDPGDLRSAKQALAVAMRGETSKMPGMVLVSRDSVRIPIIPRVTFIRDNEGKPFTIVLTIQDISDIAEANKALRENEQRLAEAQRIAHIGHWDWDLVGNTLTWSDETYRIFGLDRQQLSATYDAFLKSAHPDDRQFVQESVDKALYEDQPYSIDHRIVLPNGQEHVVHEQAEVYRNKAGRPVRMIGTVQDITARKRAENKNSIVATLSRLFAEKRTLTEYLEAAGKVLQNWSECRCLGIRILDEKDEIPYESWIGFNPEFVESECSLSLRNDQCVCIRVIAGKPDPQESRCMTVTGSFLCNDVGEFISDLSEEERTRFRGVCVANGFKSVAVIPLVHQGKILGAIHLADERPNRVQSETVAFIENISSLVGEAVHRFGVEGSLESSEEKYRRLVENLPAITYVSRVDKPMTITYVSPQIEGILGFSPADYKANPDLLLKQLATDDRERVFGEFAQAHSNTEPFVLEYRMMTRDGQTVWIRDRMAIVRDALGMPSYVHGVMYDITEEKRISEALRSLASDLVLAEERERKHLAADLHDTINQTLALSKIKLGTLNKMLESEEAKAALREVRDLFSRAVEQTRTLSFDLSPPILYELGLHAAVDWLGEKMKEQYAFEFSLSENDDLGHMEEHFLVLMFQSIRELLTNAGRHATAKRVCITLAHNDGEISAVVEDDGKGFDYESVRKRAGESRSIGLFSIEDRMRHLNGVFRVQSEPGKGSRITLTVPIKQKESKTGD